MSNKSFDKLNELDQLLRKTCPVDMNSGVQVTIELISGFELFNTRPYHNYETWSNGYRITGRGIMVESEDLDDAIKIWAEKVKKKKEDLTKR